MSAASPDNKPTKATRIDQNSVAFKWVVPATLVVLMAVTVLLILAALAVILDFIPHG